MGQQWSNEQKEELHRIWTSRKTKFDPENKKYQYQIMSHYMSALMPSVKFKPIGIEWKKMGFQGENPVTDIRAGGLLSFETLEHFASYYTNGATKMIAEITAMYLTNHERFYPFSTTAVVLCTELCDMIGISKKNRGAIKEKEMNDFLNATTSSPFLSLIETNDHGIAFNEMFSYIFADFHCRFVKDKSLGYLDLQTTVKETMETFEQFISKYKKIEMVRNAYLSKDPMIKSLLQKSGGESKGWRHLRVQLKAESSQHLLTGTGAVTAIAGKSLYINAIDSLSKHNLLDKIKPVEEIETDVSSINTTEKTSKISYGLTYKERKNNKEYSNNNTKNTRKISVMSMSRSKSINVNRNRKTSKTYIRNQINDFYKNKNHSKNNKPSADV